MIFTGQQELLRQQVADFARKKLGAHDPGKGHPSPAHLAGQMSEVGYTGILIPTEYEGQGGGLVEACIILEQLARAEPVIALLLDAHLACCSSILQLGGEVQKESFLPILARGKSLGALAVTEPEAGTDLAGIRASVVVESGGLRIDGNKCFVTNVGLDSPSVCLVAIVRDPVGLSAVWVPEGSPGFGKGHHYRFAGFGGLPNHAVTFLDCRVPEGHLLRHAMKEVEIDRLLDLPRVTVSSIALGLSRGCFEEALDYCRQRKQFGRCLTQNQTVCFRLADMCATIDIVRASLYQCAATHTSPGSRGNTCGIKLFSTTAAEGIASSAMELLAGFGFTEDSVLPRRLLEAKGLQLHWGTRDLMRMNIWSELGDQHRRD